VIQVLIYNFLLYLKKLEMIMLSLTEMDNFDRTFFNKF